MCVILVIGSKHQNTIPYDTDMMQKKYLVLFGFIVAKFILSYALVSPEYDLQRDEYLHLDQGKHLAWGYISVPPFTSWISYLINLFGAHPFWVRFFPALFGAFTMVLVWRIVEKLQGGLYALIIGQLAVLLSVILRINILYQPNSFDIFFWTLSYYCILSYVHSRQTKWFYFFAAAIAFGILSKYNIILLLAGIVPALLLSRQRTIFLNKHFYGCVLLAAIIILPNFLWQYQNDFPTARQLAELKRTQLVNVNRLDFLKDQLLFFSGFVVLVIASFIGFFRYRPFKKYQFFFWSFVFTLSLFILLRAKSYYAIGLYPIYLGFGAVYCERLLSRYKHSFFKPAFAVLLIFLSLPLILIAFPYRSPQKIVDNPSLYKSLGLLRWEDGKDHNLPQDFADMKGWKELANSIDTIYQNLADKTHCLVLCDNYGQAGAINYYSKFKGINAVSLNADYIDWLPLYRPIRHIILVQESGDDDPQRKREAPMFEKIRRMWVNENIFSREYGTTIYLLENATTDINKILREEIAATKSGN